MGVVQFLDRTTIENIWFAASKEEFEDVSEKGYVTLKPASYFEHLDVLKDDLVRLTKKEAQSLIRAIAWTEDDGFQATDAYTSLATSIIEKKQQT